MTIDFDSMEVGDTAKLTGSTWETTPRQEYDAAQAYVAAHPEKQFEVSAGWALLNGMEVREFTLSRIR